MQIRLIGLLLLAAAGAMEASATSLSAVGVLSQPRQDATLVGTPYSGKTLGAGALFSTGEILQFELGVLYVPHKVGDTGTSFHVLEVPAMFRLSPIPWISFAAGGYFSRGVGDVEVAGQVGGPARSFEDFNYARNEAGVTASVALSIGVLPMVSLVTDVRYLYGLSHVIDTTSDNSLFRGIQVLAGLSVGL